MSFRVDLLAMRYDIGYLISLLFQIPDHIKYNASPATTLELERMVRCRVLAKRHVICQRRCGPVFQTNKSIPSNYDVIVHPWVGNLEIH